VCLPQVIKLFQNYRGFATTFYPTLANRSAGIDRAVKAMKLWRTGHMVKNRLDKKSIQNFGGKTSRKISI
jgi:hypothetical protein